MAGKSEVRLIGARPSPFVARARIALNLKGVPFDFLEEKFGAKSDLLLKSNPVHKKIPVLLHHDKPVCESLVIVQYIDEVWAAAPSILPSDPYDRAIARFWAAFLDDKFFPSLGGIRKAQGKEETEAAIQQVKENVHLLEEAFVKTSRGKGFFSGGDQIGYLDIALGCFLGWMGVTERMTGTKLLDEETTPHLAKWAPRFLADPAVQGTIPEVEELLGFAKMLAAKAAAAAAAPPPK